MKKVLVAGAALLIAGSMVSAASAEVNLSGDARARYVGTSDYTRNLTLNPLTGIYDENTNGYKDNFNSRIRVKFDAKSNGGAYMHARLRFDDFTWDGQGWNAWKESKNVWADYAYIGVPVGNFDISAGRMPANFSKFFGWDLRPTRVKADWKSGNLRFIGVFDIKQEFTDSVQDEFDDNDFYAFGLIGFYKINDIWSVKGYARYQQDNREFDSVTGQTFVPADSNDPGGISAGFISVENTVVTPHFDRSGFLGSIHTNGKVAMVGVEAEIAYKASDVMNTLDGDDGWGGYIEGSLDMGAFVPALNIGFTQNGYEADPDFGFIMIGADEPITVVPTVGAALGDSWWVAFTSNYAMSDQLKFAGNLVYYDVSADQTETGGPDVRGLVDAWEISGSATYVLTEGADLTYKLGYLSPSYDGRVNSEGISDDGYFGHYLRLAIKF